jgi:Glucose-6-phosphate dehydrogenase subunit C-terminal domain/Glucose-6-phosphate dehydrogenase subunit N-terminal domain
VEQAVSSESTGRLSDTLSTLERQLEALWQPDETGRATARAYTMNLVAVCGEAVREDFSATVDDVAARLSARTFIVHVDPRAEPWSLVGDVSAVCRLEPGQAGEELCAERIELRFGAVASKRARSVLDALTESRLPTIVYAGEGAAATVVDALAPESDRIVLDSALTGVERSARIASLSGAHLEDLAFLRVRRWREMLARFFDDARVLPAVERIRAVALRHTASERGGSAEAELLVGWLGSHLGWKSAGGSLSDKNGGSIRVTLQEVTRGDVVPGCLESVALTAELDAGQVVGRARLETDAEHLSWSLETPGSSGGERRFSIPRRSPEEALSRAISSIRPSGVRAALDFVASWRAR